jgi:hypothetical protein
MAKRKKRSEVQKRAKQRRRNSATRGKARKVSKSAATKRTVARAKPKRATVKKPPRKEARRMKQPIAPVVETVAVEVIEQPAPGVITVTEVEETEVRQVN